MRLIKRHSCKYVSFCSQTRAFIDASKYMLSNRVREIGVEFRPTEASVGRWVRNVVYRDIENTQWLQGGRSDEVT
jgi:hypothetical protein